MAGDGTLPGPEEAPSEVEPAETAEAGDPGQVCRPKAHPRARQEAVLAFGEIERGQRARPNLRKANLAKLSLREADLSEADLLGAVLRGTDLSRAVLTGAVLTQSDLRGTDLTQANLTGADLSEADLTGAVLTWAVLRGANLRGADLRGARNLTQAQIDSARGDAETKLPEGLKRPEHWKSASGAGEGTP